MCAILEYKHLSKRVPVDACAGCGGAHRRRRDGGPAQLSQTSLSSAGGEEGATNRKGRRGETEGVNFPNVAELHALVRAGPDRSYGLPGEFLRWHSFLSH